MDKSKAINYDKLSPEQRAILEGKGTEAPFSGALLHNEKSGEYVCAACGAVLFNSDAKFDSGTGWPSFDQAIPGSTIEITDRSMGMTRTEVICSNCGGHLGHVFNDGPVDTTGLRYCINSNSLGFKQK
jgi:peptide-methionine (R)-S-oxide reductase